jgi:uncharacterized protein (TIGR03435 family)
VIAKRHLPWLVCVATFGAPVLSTGQQPTTSPGGPVARFEVASVKPNRSGEPRITFDLPAPDRFTAINVPLRELIRFAFDVQDARLLGGDDWIRSERFDVIAKADHALPPWGPSGPPTELLGMLRVLLAERFGLTVRQEARVLPVYALVMAQDDRRLGPALRASTLDCENQAKSGQPRPPLAAPGSVAQPTCGMRIGPGQMVMGGTPMSQLATVLPPFVQRIVIDRTGLSGAFDFQLSWTPERFPQGTPPPGAPPLPQVDPNGASIFAALQEQLGLKLESQQTSLDVVVIDRVSRPTAD